MKTARPYELKERVYQLCNKENWFTMGTNRQYDRMFHALVSEKFSARDVAVIIGVCSESPFIDQIQKKIEDVWSELEAEAEKEEDEKEYEAAEYISV